MGLPQSAGSFGLSDSLAKAKRQIPLWPPKEGGPGGLAGPPDTELVFPYPPNLSGLAKKILERMHSTPCKRVKFTGAVGNGSVTCSDPIRHCDLELVFPAYGYGTPANIAHQTPGTHCALNSVANGIKIPANLYFSLFSLDPDLEKVIFSLRSVVGHLTKVSQCAADLLAWLLIQSDGVFAVEARAHCITWDCSRQLLLDSDPRFPHPLPVTQENVAAMGLSRLTKAYRLDPKLLPPAKLKGNARNSRRRKNTVCKSV